MKIELVVAIIAGGVALASAILTIWGQSKSAWLANELQELRLAEKRRLDREKAVSRYRVLLARAAYDLQSRLYNILMQGFIEVYYDRGNDRERSYVINNTLFLAAQYFAWTEIIRRDIQYLDLGTDTQTRELARLQDQIYSLWATSEFGPLFRVFAGEQRAIGERTIHEASRGPECIGYATFLDRLRQSPYPLLTALQEDIRGFSSDIASACPRLVALQNAMIDLLGYLDPDYVRFPRERRAKVSS